MAIDANKLLASGVYEAHAPLKTIAEDLSQIEGLEAQITRQRWRLRKFAGIAFAAGVLCAIAAGVLNGAALAAFAFLGISFGVVVFFYSFFFGLKLYTHRDRLRVLKGMLNTLQHDADSRSPFSIRLALTSTPNLIREEDWPVRENGKQKFFEEDFVSLEGEMLDGTVLSQRATELTRKRTYVNQNRKSKSKVRTRYLVTLRLDYARDVYGDAQPSSAALQEEIKVPNSATVRDVRVTEKAIVAKAQVDIQEDVAQTGTMLGLGAYRILNLARRTAASGSGGKQ
jgi:hypothetical protein